MSALSIVRPGFRTRAARVTDGLAIGVAVSLPWSSAAASILILLSLLVLISTLDPSDVRREIATLAGGLPVILCALGILGSTWANVSWAERLGGIDSFLKLLMIPLLFAHFRRSDHGPRVMAGYLASCTALLAVSSTFALWPRTAFLSTNDLGVPVRDAAIQSSEFVTCTFGLLYIAIEMFRHRRRALATGMLVLAFFFLINTGYIVTDLAFVRIHAFLSIPVLFVLLVFKQFNATRSIGLLAAGATLCVVSFVFLPYLQKIMAAAPEIVTVRAWDVPEYWRRSLNFISEAPAFGHGTGSMHDLFIRSAVGQTGNAAAVTTNPGQQTFAVGIQIGLVGASVLWAMWISHVLLFRSGTLPDWIGLVIVVQSIVGSLTSLQLFDFTQGWTYVFGVGVAGGMVRQIRKGAAVR